MIIKIEKLHTPEFGRDFDVGWIGFVHRCGKHETGYSRIITGGINIVGCSPFAVIRPSHMFLVIDPNRVIEADGHDEGIIRTRNIENYFESPDYIIMRKLKREIDMTRVLEKVKDLLGEKFDEGVIFYLGFEKLLGLSRWLAQRPAPKFSSGIMCSNLIAYLFYESPEFRDLDPFNRKHWTKITPEDLWRSEELFEPCVV